MAKQNLIVTKATKPTSEMTDEELEAELLGVLSIATGRKVDRSKK